MLNPLFFPSIPPLAQQPAVPKFSIKEQFLSSPGPKRARRVVGGAKPLHSHPPLLSPADSSAQFEMGTHLSCTPCPIVEPGKCCTAHSDPATGRLPKRAPRAASLRSTSLPHCGYADGPLGPTCAVSASLVSAPQSISLAHSDHQARLCDSVRPASPQVQGCPLHFSESCRYPCLACGDRSPTGEGRDRAGPSCRYEVRVLQPLLHCTQEKRWVTTDLGSASFESEPSQATIQDAHAEMHFRVHPSPRLVCSDRPEGHVLSCLDSSST